jgi:uncharacterized protein (DUF302 family)
MTEMELLQAPATREAPTPSRGIVTMRSPYPFLETVQRLRSGLLQKGIRVFAEIDQRAAARDLGMTLTPTTLLLFGNPRAGTPLMAANPEAGLDLPLKALVTERAAGDVRVSLNTASYIIERHGLPPELEANLAPVEALVRNLLRE